MEALSRRLGESSRSAINPIGHRMSTAVVAPNKWRKRRWRLIIFGTLMSFAVGVATTAYISIRLISFAATGMATVLVGLASASMNATVNALHTGDSATRLTVLTELKKSLKSQIPQPIDLQLSALILPAIEQCRTDADPVVVDVATELADYISSNTTPVSE
jgi:hypothetical protein